MSKDQNQNAVAVIASALGSLKNGFDYDAMGAYQRDVIDIYQQAESPIEQVALVATLGMNAATLLEIVAEHAPNMSAEQLLQKIALRHHEPNE